MAKLARRRSRSPESRNQLQVFDQTRAIARTRLQPRASHCIKRRKGLGCKSAFPKGLRFSDLDAFKTSGRRPESSTVGSIPM
ncbi:MAG TPA: hypothetical protein PKD61_11975, partial [Polyangiaceae bacterium]|nr:hypothetical protein [Polyangiaceae bacterium]